MLSCSVCPTLCHSMDCSPPGSNVHGDSPSKTTGVHCHGLLQGIFPTQESNPGLLHCRKILYSLSCQGSPWILEWVAYPFFRGSSWPRNQIGVSWIAGDSLPGRPIYNVSKKKKKGASKRTNKMLKFLKECFSLAQCYFSWDFYIMKNIKHNTSKLLIRVSFVFLTEILLKLPTNIIHILILFLS